MRGALLTAAAIFACAAACGQAPEKNKAAPSDEPTRSAAQSAEPPAKQGLRAQVFRDASLPGPAYVATNDQLFMIDTDGSVDVLGEMLGIAHLERLATGDLLLHSANGLTRVSGRRMEPIATTVPAGSRAFAAAANDDAWAISKRTVHHFDGKDWRPTEVPGTSAEPTFHDVVVDARGAAWLAAGIDGLFAWEGTSWRKEPTIKGIVLHVDASPDGVFVLLPSGLVELKGSAATDLVGRAGGDAKAADVATDGSWLMLLGDASGSSSFSLGSRDAQSWEGRLDRFTRDSTWFAADTRGRLWIASKRAVGVAGKDVADLAIPLNAAVTGDVSLVEVIGRGPDKLPSEIGPAVSIPIPEASIPLPAGTTKGNVIINADPTFADGVVSNASSVIAGMAPGFRRCYYRGLLENPKLRGSLRITVKVGPNGEVQSATASPNSGIPQSVVTCLTARIMATSFAKPNVGSATLVIPLSLLPQP